MATHSSILAWKIPWTEESGEHSLWDHEESDMTEQQHTYTGAKSKVSRFVTRRRRAMPGG